MIYHYIFCYLDQYAHLTRQTSEEEQRVQQLKYYEYNHQNEQACLNSKAYNNKDTCCDI